MGASGVAQLGTIQPPTWDVALLGAVHVIGSNEPPHAEEKHTCCEALQPEEQGRPDGRAKQPCNLTMLAHAPNDAASFYKGTRYPCDAWPKYQTAKGYPGR